MLVGNHSTDRRWVFALGVAETGSDVELPSVWSLHPDGPEHTFEFALTWQVGDDCGFCVLVFLHFQQVI